MALSATDKKILQEALDNTEENSFPGLQSPFYNQVKAILSTSLIFPGSATEEDIFEFINKKLVLSKNEEEKKKLRIFMEKECPLLFAEFKDGSLKKNFLRCLCRSGIPAIASIINNIDTTKRAKIDSTAKITAFGQNRNIDEIYDYFKNQIKIENNFNTAKSLSKNDADNVDKLFSSFTIQDANYLLEKLSKQRDAKHFSLSAVLGEDPDDAKRETELKDIEAVINGLSQPANNTSEAKAKIFPDDVKTQIRKHLPSILVKRDDLFISDKLLFLTKDEIFPQNDTERKNAIINYFLKCLEQSDSYEISDILSFLSEPKNKNIIEILDPYISFADIINEKYPQTISKTKTETEEQIEKDRAIQLNIAMNKFFKAKNNILIQTGKEGTDEQKRIENLIEQMEKQPDLFKNEADLGDIKNFLITHLDNQNTAFELFTPTIATPLPKPLIIKQIIDFPEPLKAEKKDVMLFWLKNDHINCDDIVCIPKETYKFAMVGKHGTQIDFRIYNRDNNKMQRVSFEAKLICNSTKKSQCKEIPKEILKMYLKGDDEEKQKIKHVLISGNTIRHYEESLKITNIFPWLKDFKKLVDNPILMYKYLIENIDLDNDERQKVKEEIENLSLTDIALFDKVNDGGASKIEYDTNIQKAEANLKKIDVIIKTVQLDYQKEDNNNDAFQSISYATTRKLLKSKAALEQVKKEIKNFRFNTLKNPTGCFIKQKEFDVAINDINITLNYIREKIDENIKQKFAKLEVKIANNKIKDETRVKKQLQNIETAKNSIQKLLDEDKDGERLQSIVENYRALINSIDNFDFTPKQNKFSGSSVKEKLKNQLQIERESIDKQINKIANDSTLNEEQKENLIGQVRNVERTLLNNYSNVFNASKDINSFGSQKQIESLMVQSNNIKAKELKKIKLLTKQERENEKNNIISVQSINDIQKLSNIIDDVNEENRKILQQQNEKKEIILTDDANKYAQNIKNPEDVGWFYDTTNQALGFVSPVIAAGTIVGAIFIPVATIPIAIVGGVLSILGFSTFVYRRSEKNREIKLERFEEKIKIQEDALKDKTPYSNESKNINNSTNNNLNIQNSTQNTAPTPA